MIEVDTPRVTWGLSLVFFLDYSMLEKNDFFVIVFVAACFLLLVSMVCFSSVFSIYPGESPFPIMVNNSQEIFIR